MKLEAKASASEASKIGKGDLKLKEANNRADIFEKKSRNGILPFERGKFIVILC